MPYEDNEFGSIVSLGAIEHTIEGPNDSLREYARVLRPDGVAIITVPYWSSVRKIARVFSLLWGICYVMLCGRQHREPLPLPHNIICHCNSGCMLLIIIL